VRDKLPERFLMVLATVTKDSPREKSSSFYLIEDELRYNSKHSFLFRKLLEEGWQSISYKHKMVMKYALKNGKLVVQRVGKLNQNSVEILNTI
jgi:hypothetical protein